MLGCRRIGKVTSLWNWSLKVRLLPPQPFSHLPHREILLILNHYLNESLSHFYPICLNKKGDSSSEKSPLDMLALFLLQKDDIPVALNPVGWIVRVPHPERVVIGTPLSIRSRAKQDVVARFERA